MWNQIRKISSCNPNVWKYVFEKNDAVAESVLYRYPTFQERTVICCSTQSGCPVGCRFCGAGDHFVRSLTYKEILSQPFQLINDISLEHDVVDINKLQIMFMSMGEPLLNFANLGKAIADLYTRYRKAKLLISTIGPKIDYDPVYLISQEIENVGLQFSIHESLDEERNKLIPIKGKLSLEEIARTGEMWYKKTGRQPFFNYCAHAKNSSDEDAERLSNLFDPSVWQATISVICERDENVAAANQRQKDLAANFQAKLKNKGYETRMFDPAGQDDIGGGCGQLWFVQSWMKQHIDKVKQSVGYGLPIVHTPI